MQAPSLRRAFPGTFAWASLSGDPLAWDWVNRCGERLRGLKLDLAQADARTGVVHSHMMCQFHSYTGDARYLEAVKAPKAWFE